MIIHKMTASYGRLEDDTLELKPGLNIITAPNESGKSTWCSFIKNMLYGVDSSAREKGGVKPDKALYAPWSGALMSGSMEIEQNGRQISLTRTGTQGAPMRDLSAVFAETSQPVPGLSGSTGEALLGVPREVFERTAFIRQSAVAVNASPELEKRIATIVQTGDESASFTDAEEILRAAMRRRRHNKSGALPELERRHETLRDKVREIETEESRGDELREAIKLAIEKRDNLTKQVAESREKQRKRTLNELGAARERIGSLETELEGLKTEAADIEQELRAGRFGTEEPEKVRESTAHDLEKASQLSAEAEKTGSRAWNIFFFAAAVLTIACIVFAVLAPSLALTGLLLTIASSPTAYLPAGVFGIIAVVIFVIMSNTKNKRKALQEEINSIFSKYEVTGAEDLKEAIARHEQLYERLDKLLSRRVQTQAQLEIERREQKNREADILRDLNFSGSATALTRLLEEAEATLRRLREELAANEGRLDAMGGSERFSAKIGELTKEHRRLSHEYEALRLAADTLKEAGIEIQNRMTPRLSRRASEIFHELTGGRYEAVALDRELKAMARLNGDNLPRESVFLSVGALDQLYLAVRLALCELALPEEKGEKAPVILDDALGSFDDARCEATLLFLRDIAASRQVMLFTCHGRESELMRQYEDVNIITL